MNYQVIARKYRPETFDNVIGQNHVTQTLRNAINAKRIAHAYLFSGPRGVGKTTTARLLAKALNCIHGPTENPCGVCSRCKEISEGTSLQVVEVDGASNNGVEQVRTLTDTIKYNTDDQQYKIYIIDEVHMLTIAAFNALLKNLEEPPPKVVFIFATTELHKVPITIQSRCQNFVFNLIDDSIIQEKLKKILESQNIQYEPDILSIVSVSSGGSMRDAESILEKVITFCGDDMSVHKTYKALGLVSHQMLTETVFSFINHTPQKLFDIIQKIVSEGRHIEKYIKSLIDIFRILLLYHVSKSEETIPKELHPIKTEIIDWSSHFKENQILYILEQLCLLENQIKHSPSPRVLIEISFMKLCNMNHIVPIEDLLKHLNELEEKISVCIQKKKEINQHQVSNNTSKKNSQSKQWTDFLSHLELKNNHLKSYLNNAHIKFKDHDVLTIIYPEENVFHAKTLSDANTFNILKKEISGYFEKNYDIQIEIDTSIKKEKPLKNKPQFPTIQSNKKINEFMNKILETFQGEIYDIESPRNQSNQLKE